MATCKPPFCTCPDQGHYVDHEATQAILDEANKLDLTDYTLDRYAPNHREWQPETRREAAWIYTQGPSRNRQAILDRYRLTWGELITAAERTRP